MQISVTYNEDLARAVRERDIKRLTSLVDAGRRAGETYAGLLARASAATGISEAEWETLMEECDDLDSGVER